MLEVNDTERTLLYRTQNTNQSFLENTALDSLSSFTRREKGGELWRSYINYKHFGSSSPAAALFEILSPEEVMQLQSAAPELDMETIASIPATHFVELYQNEIRYGLPFGEHEKFCRTVSSFLKENPASEKGRLVHELINDKGLSVLVPYPNQAEVVDSIPLILGEVFNHVYGNPHRLAMLDELSSSWQIKYGNNSTSQLWAAMDTLSNASSEIFLNGRFGVGREATAGHHLRYALVTKFMEEAELLLAAEADQTIPVQKRL